MNTTGNDTSGTGTADNPYLTIQTGINNLDPDGTLRIANGQYNGTDNTRITLNQNLTIIGESQEGTIINGTDTNWIFNITAGVNVSIYNLTLTNGNTTGQGGAIYNEGNLTVTNCTFNQNQATDGGAISNHNVGFSPLTCTVTESTFNQNQATNAGGAINNINVGGSVTCTVTESTFNQNQAYRGGAICNENRMTTPLICTVTKSTFKQNQAYRGGAIANHNFGNGPLTFTVSESTFNQNQAINDSLNPGRGGAIYNYQVNGNLICTVTESTFNQNQATDSSIASSTGGAIYSIYSVTTLHFNRFYNNTATIGNTIYNNGGSVDAQNNWWGTNNPDADWSQFLSGVTSPTMWVVLTINATPDPINNTQNSSIQASFNFLFNGTDIVAVDPAVGHIPDGTPVTFSLTNGPYGVLNGPLTVNTINGLANIVFTASAIGTQTVQALVDYQLVTTPVAITRVADVVITKEFVDVNGNPVNSANYHETIYVRITLTNNGPDPAYGVFVNDTFSNYLFISQSHSKLSYDNGTTWTDYAYDNYSYIGGQYFTWDLIDGWNGGYPARPIGAGEVFIAWIPVIIETQDNEIISNTASINNTLLEQVDPDLSNNVANDSIVANPESEIIVTKSVDNSTPNVGDVINYTIIITNNGPDNATSVVIHDVIPAGLNLDFGAITVNGDWSDCGINWLTGLFFICFRNISTDSSVTVTLPVTVSAAVAGQHVNNTASLFSLDQYDPDSSDNEFTVGIDVPVASYVDVSKEFRDLPWGNQIESAYYHDVVYAMVCVQNQGPDATSLTIEDLLTGMNWTGNYYTLSGLTNPADLDNWVLNDAVNTFNGVNWTIPNFSSAIGGNVKWLALEVLVNQTGMVSNYAETVNQSSYAYQGYGNYTAYLTADAAPTSLVVNSASGYNGDMVYITATLTDTAHNTPVINKEVTITINGQNYTAHTDSNGQITWNYLINNMDAQDYTINVAFAGDNQYNSSNSNGTLTVNLIPTNITVDDVRGNKGDTVTLKAVLTDYLGNPLEGETVEFWIDNVKVGENTTDSTGTALFNYAISETPGNHNLTAIFSETGLYQESNATGELYVPTANLYIQITSNKNNPTVDEKFTVTYKLGNSGPDDADNVTVIIPIPEGFHILQIYGDGNWTVNSNGTITWTFTNVTVGDPYLYLYGYASGAEDILFSASIFSDTYNLNTLGVNSLSLQVLPDETSEVNAVTTTNSNTVGMQNTGIPLPAMVLAILMVLGGFISTLKKQ